MATSGTAPLLDSMIAERILLGFQVRAEALQSRLPAPWRVGSTPAGANLVVIFNEVFLNQDAGGAPAPDATTRYLGVVVPGRRPDIGEEASINLRIFAAHPQAIPGKYRTSFPAVVRRQQRLVSEGLATTVEEHCTVRVPAGEEIDFRLRYTRDAVAHTPTRSRGRSAADPAILRLYRVDQLAYTVRDASQGVDHVLDFAFRATVTDLSDLIDGTERLLTVAASPWYHRRVYAE